MIIHCSSGEKWDAHILRSMFNQEICDPQSGSYRKTVNLHSSEMIYTWLELVAPFKRGLTFVQPIKFVCKFKDCLSVASCRYPGCINPNFVQRISACESWTNYVSNLIVGMNFPRKPNNLYVNVHGSFSDIAFLLPVYLILLDVKQWSLNL